jgi:hypothetical protein
LHEGNGKENKISKHNLSKNRVLVYCPNYLKSAWRKIFGRNKIPKASKMVNLLRSLDLKALILINIPTQ